MQEQTPIKLTPEQEKAYKARMKYIEKHSVKNPNNPKYEMVILEKDGSLTLTGGSEKTGIAIINRDTIKHQDMPYWRVIKANFDFYKKKNRKYYNLIVEFLQERKKWDDIQMCFKCLNRFGEVLEKQDIDRLLFKLNRKNLDTYNALMKNVEQILKSAELFGFAIVKNEDGSETSAEQRLKIIADKVREARALITQQYEVNKNEQSDRNL